MTALRLAAIAALATAAVLAALLAADVRAWPAALDNGDAVYTIAPRHAQWVPATNLGGLSEALLGTAGDVTARVALRSYRDAPSAPRHRSGADPLATPFAVAIDALSSPASSANPEVAAQARTLLGILTFDEASAGGGVSPTDTAIADFTEAIRAEPGDTSAKFDLELLLRLGAPTPQRHRNRIAQGLAKTGGDASGSVHGSGF